ncbi:hypothetical protein BDU57DRAFT_304255 [Ampelomyces quisqualis]|uniref:Uncharacterized protein n=1 Tax=Ampelomyces quisqualis TaxID=50730 RepID=A0A6A5QGY7_AMPQU|nr:hypothetical protein BDU57DRAFT_304255 [Ampelomyces quisqualis]
MVLGGQTLQNLLGRSTIVQTPKYLNASCLDNCRSDDRWRNSNILCHNSQYFKATNDMFLPSFLPPFVQSQNDVEKHFISRAGNHRLVRRARLPRSLLCTNERCGKIHHIQRYALFHERHEQMRLVVAISAGRLLRGSGLHAERRTSQNEIWEDYVFVVVFFSKD